MPRRWLRRATSALLFQTLYVPGSPPHLEVVSLKHDLVHCELETEVIAETSLAQPQVVPLVIPAYW